MNSKRITHIVVSSNITLQAGAVLLVYLTPVSKGVSFLFTVSVAGLIAIVFDGLASFYFTKSGLDDKHVNRLRKINSIISISCLIAICAKLICFLMNFSF